MKSIFLVVMIYVLSLTAHSQQTNDLRGVRYYYSTPSAGTFGAGLTCFRPEYIEELNDHYILSGFTYFFYQFKSTTLSINKETSTIEWDFLNDADSRSQGLSITSDNNVLMAFDNSAPNDSVKFVSINQNGSFSTNTFKAVDTLFKIHGFSRLESTINMASGHSEYDDSTALATIMTFDDFGNILDKGILSSPTIAPNLIIFGSTAMKTFKYRNEYISFGHLVRSISTNHPLSYTYCPSIWHWKNDTLIYSRELFSGFNDQPDNYCNRRVEEIDGKNNEFVFAYQGNFELNGDGGTYISFLDSNLNISWEHKIGSWPEPWVYFIHDLKFDKDSNYIYTTGFVYDQASNNVKSFLAKYRRNGTLVFFKYFTIDRGIIYSIKHLQDGDLLFAGEGQNNNGVRYFFTYRTGPDGYHPDGQYLGIQEITASETEIGIFPNPSDGIFHVSSISTESMKITMLDQQGKQVAQFELDELSSNNSFDLSDQAPGVYFAHVSQGEQQWVKKLVVR
jgi:hypothetical protein